MKLDKSNAIYQYVQRLERRFRTSVILPVKKLFFRRRLRHATPLLLYQMGKVASTTVYRALLGRYPGVIASAHTLANSDWKSQLIYDWYKRGNPVRIISLTREPISRNVSSFFQRFEAYVGEPFSKSRHSVEELHSIFLERYEHDWVLNWFDQHIQKYFGIDIYSSEFPESGYAEYRKDNVSLLVLKCELDDAIKQKAIGDFLGISGLEFVNGNIGTEKEYAMRYREFKKSLNLDEEFRKSFTDSKYYRHFYGSRKSGIG